MGHSMLGAIHLKMIAGSWSTFKRGVVGTFHRVGREHRRSKSPSSSSAVTSGKTWTFSQRRSWMLKEPKWFAAILTLGYLGFVEALSWETSTWPLCIVVGEYQPASANSAQAACVTFFEGIVQFLGFLWDHADAHAVTAFAAILIAIFTWTLWRSSEKMWSVTRVAANAAKQSADALVAAEQAQLLTIFEASNIPHVLSELGRHDHPASAGVTTGERVSVRYVFKNYGKSPAILKEISHDLQHWNDLPDELRYFPIPEMPKERAVMAGGSTESFQCIVMAPLTAGAATSIRTGDSFLWLYGHVVYDDAFGREREHRFLYRYRIGHGFQPYDYKNYNKNT